MRALTVGILSLLGMAGTSAAVTWGTAPTPAAQAATAPKPVVPPAPPAMLSLPGVLSVEARAAHSVLPSSGRPETHLLIRLTAPNAATRQGSAHVVVLVDRSGSMRGRRLANALAAARGVVSRLADGDRVTLLAYDTRVTTLFPTTVLDPETRARALTKLEDRAAAGNTCISCGLEAALGELARSSGHVSHVLLLSDGEATAGEKSLEGFQRIARRAREQGVSLSSIGIDLDYDEALLSTLARFSNGQHHFARDAAELALAFDAEISALGHTAASDAVLDVDLPDGVELVRVYDREVEQVGRRLRVRMGSFAAAEEKTLLLALRLPEGGPKQTGLASFSLDYKTGDQRLSAKGALAVDRSDALKEPGEPDPTVAARIGRSRTGSVLFDAGKLFKSGSPADFASADQKLGEELDRVRRSASAKGADAADLERQSEALSGARDRLRATRGAHCACAPSDLSCAMKCSAGGKISPAEKAAAKESVSASNPFQK